MADRSSAPAWSASTNQAVFGVTLRLGDTVNILSSGTNAGGGEAYRADASALFEYLEVIDAAKAEHVLAVSGEHIYKIGYGLLLPDHIASGAAVRIAQRPIVELRWLMPPLQLI